MDIGGKALGTVMKLLLNYYHPVIFDLAESFSRIFDEVVISCDMNLEDNYGGFNEVKNRVKENEHLNCQVIPDIQAKIQIKQFDLVGLDGAFKGDDILMETCKGNGVPYFCINGYPHQFDEPGENILAFSWHLPQIQYKKRFPHEGYVKLDDWKHIAKNGRSPGKNVCVFYPEMNEAKRFNTRFLEEFRKEEPKHFCSFIHRYEECNKFNYLVFEHLKNHIDTLENYSGLSQREVFEKMSKSYATVHLKHADCPGISVLESLTLGIPVITMESFVKASFNQEVLIDGFNAIIATDKDDLVKRTIELIKWNGLLNYPMQSIRDHINVLTSFRRQKYKLEKFFEECMK